jgi:hypothetical protein
MTTLTLTETTYEELASRENNGIRVSLMWNCAKNDAKVTVYDASDDSSFELGVEDAPPLDVFNHPFAYAAFRGLTCTTVDVEATVEPIAA